MLVFCTLFNLNYLDKGLLMYRSLVLSKCNFKMYVLAMDMKCKEILDAYNYKNVITIPFEHFSKQCGLEEIRQTRSIGELCWTCTSFLIDYVLNVYKESICTYVDADMYFYKNPKCLIDEMGDKTVQIVEHRYNPTMMGKLSHAAAGTYCVEFNTFKNTSDSLKLLQWWKEKCYESCTISGGGKTVWGDQGYLEDWGRKGNVSVLKHLGGGMAPWNVVQYQLISNEEEIIVREKRSKMVFPLIFYHFHNIAYYSEYEANIGVFEPWREDKSLVTLLYTQYLQNLNLVKKELKLEFGIFPLIKSHPGITKGTTQHKRGFLERLKTLDSLFVPRLYRRFVGKQKLQKYEHLNILKF